MYPKIEFILDKDENENAKALYIITHEIALKAFDIGQDGLGDIMAKAHNALGAAYLFGEISDA